MRWHWRAAADDDRVATMTVDAADDDMTTKLAALEGVDVVRHVQTFIKSLRRPHFRGPLTHLGVSVLESSIRVSSGAEQ